MKIYARIDNAVVSEIISPMEGFALEQCFAPEVVAQCVEIPKGKTVEQGWTYDGKSFSPPALPPAPTLEEAKDAKLAEVLQSYSAAFAPIDKMYPSSEREGWPIQEAEAKALMADATAQTPVLSALVQLRSRGESVADLARKVLENAGIWRMIYAFLTGQQQRMYADVSALDAVEAVQAYVVKYQMPEGLG